jgi:hypothetical protein
LRRKYGCKVGEIEDRLELMRTNQDPRGETRTSEKAMCLHPPISEGTDLLVPFLIEIYLCLA